MKKQNIKQHHRRSIRLKEYDYSKAGAYFATICTLNKKHIFGGIRNGLVELSMIGKIANKFWFEIPKHFEDVKLDEFIIMPNHIHGIIFVNDVNVGVQNFEPLQKQNRFQQIIPKSIGSIIRAYKSSVTHWGKLNGYEHFKWQRNYWEHVIRNEDKQNKIRQYIQFNPLKWHLDRENPERVGADRLEDEIFDSKIKMYAVLNTG